ncbi:hypothetical protein PIB30_074945, partial [Stylosanthes scabra]|nr:hypothetical protein [Stylosanthes scabra]
QDASEQPSSHKSVLSSSSGTAAVVDINNDIADFPSDLTPTPISTPNPNPNATPNSVASPLRIPESPPHIVKRAPKGRVTRSARKTLTKRTTTTIPENQVQLEPDTQNQTCPQPPNDNELELEGVVENQNASPAQVELQAGGHNASQGQSSTSRNQKNRRASYKRPALTGQAIVQGRRGEAPKIFFPHVNSPCKFG